MELNLEFLEKRMIEIMSQEDKIMAQMNYLSGAKNECQYLINSLKEGENNGEPRTVPETPEV